MIKQKRCYTILVLTLESSEFFDNQASEKQIGHYSYSIKCCSVYRRCVIVELLHDLCHKKGS